MKNDQSYLLQRRIVWGVIGLDALFALVATFFLFTTHAHYLNDITRTAENIVKLLDLRIADKVRLIDDALIRTEREINQQMAAGGIDSMRLNRILKSEQKQLPEIDAIRVTNTIGDVCWGKGVTPEITHSYADREFFRKFRDDGIHDLIITEPIKGKVSELWVIAFTRSYRTAEGQFSGVISAAVPVESFRKLITTPDLEKTDTIVLRYADMGLIARNPPIGGPAGEPGNKKVSAEFIELIQSGQQAAMFHTEKTPDGIERTYAFRRIDNCPFTLAVGLNDDRYLATWKTQLVWVSIVYTLFFSMTALYAWSAVRNLWTQSMAERGMQLHLTIMETVAEGVFLVGVADNIIKWTNRKFETMFGYAPGEMIGMHVDNINAPTDRTPTETRISIVDPLIQDGEWHGEILNIKKDGTPFWCFIHVTLFDHPDFGKVMVAAHIDITERKRLDTALRESEEKYRVLFHNELNAICIYDVETFRFIDVNDTYIKLYGYSRDELLGDMTIHDITVQHQESVDATHRALSDGTIYVPLRFHKKKDGTVFPVELIGGPHTWKGKKVMFGIARDISERRQAEEAVKAALQEKEFLLREIHHRVKNNMQVISSLLNLQAKQIENKDVQQALNESQQRVISMALIHETLYSGQNLATIDLENYLMKLVHHLEDVYADQPDISIEMAVENVQLNIDQAIPCGLILNELITNAYKHAFHDGRKGVVQIRAHVDGNQVVIDVSDNGVGFSIDREGQEPSTLGMRLVNGLLKHQLKGQMDITRDGGSHFTLRWALREEQGDEP